MAVPSDTSMCNAPVMQYVWPNSLTPAVEHTEFRMSTFCVQSPKDVQGKENEEFEIPADFFLEPPEQIAPEGQLVAVNDVSSKPADRKRKPGAFRGKEFVWEAALREAGSDEQTAQELHAALIDNAVSPLQVLSLPAADLAATLRAINIRPEAHHALVNGAVKKQAQSAPIKVRKKERRKKDGTINAPVDPNKPKKPYSSYVFFCKETRMNTRAAHPHLKPVEIESLLGRLWNELTRPAKTVYEDLAKQDVARYKKELEVYQAGLQAQQPQQQDRASVDLALNLDGVSQMYRDAEAATVGWPATRSLANSTEACVAAGISPQAGAKVFPAPPFSPMIQADPANGASVSGPPLDVSQLLDVQFAQQMFESAEAFQLASQLPFHLSDQVPRPVVDKSADSFRLASQLPFHHSAQVFGEEDARRLPAHTRPLSQAFDAKQAKQAVRFAAQLPFHLSNQSSWQLLESEEAMRLAAEMPFHLSDQGFGSDEATRVAAQLPAQAPSGDEASALAAQLPFYPSDQVVEMPDEALLASQLPFHSSNQVMDDVSFWSVDGFSSPIDFGLCGLISVSGVDQPSFPDGIVSDAPLDDALLLSGPASPPLIDASEPFDFDGIFDAHYDH
eukprot:TRINITY_DN32550_c0_g1_i2.p1 TRINITY_DN32550_c0_g1~~TRINITY_DN32550_c0_g1_i2.p1  ORF type:complete len:617 (-),score=205.49 TRINITY_DN32550_c0_g1_i2:311-2161(-)